MDWAFNSFQDVQLFAVGDQVTQAPVWLGETATVGLTVAQPATVTMPMGWRNTVKVAVDYPAPVPAPIVAGQVIGRINVTGPGIPSGQAATEAQLVAMTDVGRLGLPGRALARLRHFITGA
jgi:serine-type D-Ala-D-Ala carboxypeptidase (penicillin-binding protein 5/6)